MTPVPLDLPVRPPEVAELANLILDVAEGKPLSAEVRRRIAARGAALRLETIRPHFGSLSRDPVHHSSYYLAIDAAGGVPLLLHIALGSAPTSAIFAGALLIGRMPRRSGRDIVVNAIPFGPGDAEAIASFAAQIDPAFLPKPCGSRTVVVAGIADAANDLPAAFAAFQAVQKRSGRNVAGVAPAAWAAGPRGFHAAAVWAAVRAGWQEGFACAIHIPADERARETIREAAAYSLFVIELASADAAALETAGRLHSAIREARSAQKIKAPFDFEVHVNGTPPPCAEAGFPRPWLVRHAIETPVSRILETAETLPGG